jgi:ABC-2 type transport system permease protein
MATWLRPVPSMGADSAVLAGRSRIMPWSRVMGLGSVYAKTVRDSRRAALVVGFLGGLMMLATATPYGTEFTTPESRAQLVAQMAAMPAVFRGLLGEPINIDTLGGFLSWRAGNFLPVLMGIWSVIALSGTLAGEQAKGSLDLVVATPRSRRAIALQKVAGHVTALAVAMLITAVLITIAGQAFAVLPGDEIPFSAALGQVVLYGLLMLAAGALAFAVSMLVGRGRAIAIGLVALFGMYLISSYATLAPTIEALSPISWYAWTAGHRPMAGVTDWPSVALLAVVTVALLGAGILAFVRRDLVGGDALAWLRFPSLPAGIGGPLRRQLSDRATVAIAAGGGVGLYAALIASSAEAFTETLTSVPGFIDYINAIYPDIDFSQPSGILQLAFFAFGSLILGLTAAGLLAGWGSDEGARRLDVVLSTPLSRAGWFIRSGLGVYAAIGLAALILGVIVAIAVATQGGDVTAPVAGAGILGLAAAGFAGIGLAVGGLVRSSLAAAAAGIAVIATFLLDTLGGALDLPDVVLDLSIYAHLGQPMAGTYDPVGIVAALVLAVGGLLVGAWGLQRRDVGG